MYYAGNFSSGSPTIEGADANPEAALTLILRLLGRGIPGDATRGRVLVGRLPEGLPFDIPLPAGARVVGSHVLGSVATMVLDVDLTESGVLDFYRDRLQAEGWTMLESPGMHGGFASTGLGLPLPTFCRSPRGPALSLQATALESGATDVRLNLNVNARQSPCAAHHGHSGIHDLLPSVPPPDGAQQIPQGGGGGGDSYYSTATLHTTLDLAAVAAHYAERLRQAGWEARGQGQDGPAAWSAWTFRDDAGEEWQGLLYMLRRPAADGQYVLYLRADASGDTMSIGGWTSNTLSR